MFCFSLTTWVEYLFCTNMVGSVQISLLHLGYTFRMVDMYHCYGLSGKESACNAGNMDLIPGMGRFPWRRKWQTTAVILPGESHGQRNLAGYSPQRIVACHLIFFLKYKAELLTVYTHTQNVTPKQCCLN